MFIIDFHTYYSKMSMTVMSSLNHSLNVCVSRLDENSQNVGLTRDVSLLKQTFYHVGIKLRKKKRFLFF